MPRQIYIFELKMRIPLHSLENFDFDFNKSIKHDWFNLYYIPEIIWISILNVSQFNVTRDGHQLTNFHNLWHSRIGADGN